MATELAPRITVDPAVRNGRPVVAGTRVPVEDVLDLVASGLAFETIIRDGFPHLTVDDIRACVRYAAQLVRDEEVNVSGGP